MGYRRPSYLSDATNEQLLALSGQCNMRIDYMYQLYEILNSYTALTIEQDISILNRVCGMVDRRRQRYGLSPRGNVRLVSIIFEIQMSTFQKGSSVFLFFKKWK